MTEKIDVPPRPRGCGCYDKEGSPLQPDLVRLVNKAVKDGIPLERVLATVRCHHEAEALHGV